MAEVPGKRITLSALEEMFESIEKQTPWKMSEDMLWGYFFTHSSPGKLQEVAELLSREGYRVVSIYLSDKDRPSDPDVYWLHVEMVETHTPESLDERNNQLYLFADEHGVDSYDGMEVGPVPR